jgi:hypothetical protein
MAAMVWSEAANAARVPLQDGAVALGLFASDPSYNYEPMLREIIATGAKEVVLAVVWSQRTVASVDIHRHPTWTASDDNVVRTLQQAHALGMRTVLFPLLQIEQRAPQEWRGVLQPSAGVPAWFAGYRGYVLRMADLAAQGGADALSVGSEFASLESHADAWRALIANVRTRYAGTLLYSANWDHFEEVAFWDAVDVIGVTAYNELQARDSHTPPKPSDVRAAWQGPVSAWHRVRARTGKPVVVTELGYPSVRTAAQMPWNEASGATHDEALAAQMLETSCAVLRPAVDGLAVWNWFGAGGPTDDGYSPRGKPLMLSAVRACMSHRHEPSH